MYNIITSNVYNIFIVYNLQPKNKIQALSNDFTIMLKTTENMTRKKEGGWGERVVPESFIDIFYILLKVHLDITSGR